MLNLPNLKILDMKESEYDYRFLVESTTLRLHIIQSINDTLTMYKNDWIRMYKI